MSSVAETEHIRALEHTWRRHRGVLGWIGDTTHTTIGRRFLVTAFVMFVLGGLLALTMRLQLARPEQHLVGPDLYNQIFTTHGSTMMFLFAVPVMQGLGLYIVPIMVGTRNVAFPRLAAFSWWMYVFGGALLYIALFLNTGPDAGWFAYTPLSGPMFGAGKRVDIWAQMITFTEISSLGVSVNLIVTILKMRAPGMSLDRLPMFCWAQLVTSFMVVFAMPAVMLASTCLALDRLVGTQFFNHAAGGDHVLWQHLFWFFGHPEVYIIFIPALGIVSTIIVSSLRRPLFAYMPMVLSLVATGFLGFGLWVHHMFATGLPQIGQSFFTAASMMIAIPTGVQFFCWIATLATGKATYRTSFFFILGFFLTFLIGGLTGVMLASVPIDLQVHDTFFVVAHLHYVLLGGAVFPLLGGLYHWWPKLTGRMLDERLGKWNAAFVVVGFNLTFLPMHQLGYRGMPRRVYTYGADRGWGDLNMLATIGAFVLAIGVVLFVVNAARSFRLPKNAPADPWLADSLEWSTASPPPRYGFVHLPTVNGRYPRWSAQADQAVVRGLSTDKREVLITDLLDAAPDHRHALPDEALSPFFAALTAAITIVACIFTPWGLPAGGALFAIVMVSWFWPRFPKPHFLARHA
jgi:cytochrome c oxidase subunit I+III